MSTVKQFIISAITNLTNVFHNVQCRYEYDNLSDAHYIEVLPSKFFKESKELKSYRGEMLDDFYKLFADESVVFVTEGSRIKIRNPEFKVAGSKYPALETVWMNFGRNLHNISNEDFLTDLAGPFNYALAA